MKCPNCGAVYEDRCRFCGVCGTALEPEAKGRHRVPIAIMAVLTVLGLCLFFATGGTLVPEATDIPQVHSIDGPDFYIEDGAAAPNSVRLWDTPEITVPEVIDGQTVTAIDSYAFSCFTYVSTVHLPDTVTEIRYCAFEYCDSLRAMDLPHGVTVIDDFAFYDCYNLEAIRIPATVSYIGEGALAGCQELAFIFYDGTIAQWQSIFDQELPPDTAVCCSDGTFYQDE